MLKRSCQRVEYWDVSSVSADATSEIGDRIPPIVDTDPHVLRARKTAAWTRATLGAMGIALVLSDSGLLTHPSLALAGFAVISVSAMVQLSAPRLSWMRTEESLAGVAGVLIIGLQSERVSVISIVWLAAVASGVLARGGRVHWIGRTVVVSALLLPILRSGHLSLNYAALFGATTGLLLTSGRLTRELNHLLHQARYDADHDDLTGLLSYAAFRATLERTVECAPRSTPVSLLLLDLERFGVVNKTHGHAAGDALLAAVGESLLAVAGRERPVGRLGGDEFAVAPIRSCSPKRCWQRCPNAPRTTLGRSPRAWESPKHRPTETAVKRCCVPPTSRCASPSAAGSKDRSPLTPAARSAAPTSAAPAARWTA
jgi:hypothetical protein